MASMSPSLRAAVELTRPGNAVAAGVLTFTGAFVSGGVAAAPLAIAAAVLATVAATAGGNAINDYFDRAIDAVNQPDRPIPRGAISARGALGVSTACFAVATVAALTLPLIAVGIAVVNLLALVVYTEWFKSRPLVGNALVAYLTGSAFLFGGAALGPSETLLRRACCSCWPRSPRSPGRSLRTLRTSPATDRRSYERFRSLSAENQHCGPVSPCLWSLSPRACSRISTAPSG